MTVLGVDEQDSPHHAALRDADDLGAMPVIVADLHSSLPAILAGIRESRPDAVVAYVATDGGALPISFSRTVHGLREAGWLAGSVTVGQAFGGDLEAVTVHNGLLAARLVMGADVAVVTQGPGNLGTGTRWGFSGVAAGEAINAASTLNGHPVATLRVSEADSRERHHGISHHSLTAYGRVAAHTADIPVPAVSGPFGDLLRSQAATLNPPHTLVDVDLDGLGEAVSLSPVPLSTMGRDFDDDPAAFLAAGAAGRHAASAAGLADVQQIDHEDQGLARQPMSSAFRAVGEGRRTDQLAASAHLHARNALLPAFDQVPQGERDGLAAVPRRVELLAAVVLDSDVVHRDSCARWSLCTVADGDLVDDELGRGRPTRKVDLRLLRHGSSESPTRRDRVR